MTISYADLFQFAFFSGAAALVLTAIFVKLHRWRWIAVIGLVWICLCTWSLYEVICCLRESQKISAGHAPAIAAPPGLGKALDSQNGER